MSNKLSIRLSDTVVFLLFLCFQTGSSVFAQKIFDVHLHGAKDKEAQLLHLEKFNVYKVALSSSWESQNGYADSSIHFLRGLMFPCPNGKVPYSLQPCFTDGSDWPKLSWVEVQIKEGKIDFLGELLNQYYGIAANDPLLFPYYALADRYGLPVGIHTGGAGPNHGSLNFKMELGNPVYIDSVMASFPKLKVWAMHAGDQFYQETIRLMKKHPSLYTDISVVSNPAIVPTDKFAGILKDFINAGLEDRLMFGTDNADIKLVVEGIEKLDFLSQRQKEKIYFENAERFFSK